MVKEYFCDILFINAKVMTVDGMDSIKEAVGILDNRIVFVGTTEKARLYRGKNTKVIDAKGRSVVPGFIDAHTHFALYGLLGNGIINVDYSNADSIVTIKNMIKEESKKKKKGEWIILSGYDDNKLIEKRHPTIEDLDEVAPDNPVQCIRCCAHMAVYNSAALLIGGVSSPKQYQKGEVFTDSCGKLTGLLKETAHMEMSKKVNFSDQEILNGIKKANDIMIKNGITSVHDAGSYGMKVMNILQKTCLNKEIDVRVRPMVFDLFGKKSGTEFICDYIKTGMVTNIGNERFKLGPVKIMIDGSTSGPSSLMREPYSHDKKLNGIQVWQGPEIDEIVLKAHKAGYQITAHAVGDKAVELMLNAYEKALAEYPDKNRRHRIEHCGINDPELINRISELGIIPVANPSFISIYGSDYNRFYGKRVEYMFPLKSYLDRGIITAIGSDAPVTEPNPMYSIYGAATRKDYKSKEICGKKQQISILEIIRMFTYNGAYSSSEEEIKGSIETGKLADIVMLSDDINSIPAEKLMEVEVMMTMIDGKIVYCR